MSGKAVFFVLTTLIGFGWAFYLLQQVDRLDKAQAALTGQLNACRTQNTQLEQQVNESSRTLAELRKRGDVIYSVGLLVSLAPVQQRQPADSAPAPGAGSLNLGAVATLGVPGGETIRFTNPDLLATLDSGELRIAFEPENPNVFLHRQIGDLSHFKTVDVDYSSIFPLAGLSLSGPATLTLKLRVNDLELIEKQVPFPANAEPTLRFSVDLSGELPGIERLYTRALRAEAARSS